MFFKGITALKRPAAYLLVRCMQTAELVAPEKHAVKIATNFGLQASCALWKRRTGSTAC